MTTQQDTIELLSPKTRALIIRDDQKRFKDLVETIEEILGEEEKRR